MQCGLDVDVCEELKTSQLLSWLVRLFPFYILLDNFCGYTANECMCWHIMRNNCSGGDNSSIANCHTF